MILYEAWRLAKVTSQILTILLTFLLTGYFIVQFLHTKDKSYVVALTLIFGYVIVAILTWLSSDHRFLGASLETWLLAFLVLVVLIFIYPALRVLLPYLFLNPTRAYAQALNLLERGDVRRASRIAHQLVILFPKRADARYLIGKLLNEQGKYHEAVRQLRLAHKLVPEFVGTLLELGFALKMLGRYREAADVLQQVLALEPTNTYAADLLSACQEQLQDNSSAPL